MTELDRPLRILFVCLGNACRSQMAEGWARHLKADVLEVASAGVSPYHLDPRTVQVMAEAGIDMRQHLAKGLDDVCNRSFDWVITLCPIADRLCPAFPGGTKVFLRGFLDPFGARGNEEQALQVFRKVRDEIGDFVRGLPESLDSTGF